MLLVFQLTYSKHLVTGLGLTSIWSPVLYTNALSLLPTAVIGQLSGDFAALSTREWTSAGLSWLLLSCVAGMGISWAGFKCQALITATAYTVVGVMNKLLTVTANVRPPSRALAAPSPSPALHRARRDGLTPAARPPADVPGRAPRPCRC